jgi:hypothetical protein
MKLSECSNGLRAGKNNMDEALEKANPPDIGAGKGCFSTPF